MPKTGGERLPSATVPKEELDAALHISLVVVVSLLRSAHRQPIPRTVRLRRTALVTGVNRGPTRPFVSALQLVPQIWAVLGVPSPTGWGMTEIGLVPCTSADPCGPPDSATESHGRPHAFAELERYEGRQQRIEALTAETEAVEVPQRSEFDGHDVVTRSSSASSAKVWTSEVCNQDVPEPVQVREGRVPASSVDRPISSPP